MLSEPAYNNAFFGQGSSAIPKFLAVLRVPRGCQEMLCFPMVFEGFPYAFCGAPTTNEPTEIRSPNMESCSWCEMLLQPMVFDGFPITIRFPHWPPGCLWRALSPIRASEMQGIPMVFKVAQLIPRRRQDSIHFHPRFQWWETTDFHWFYNVFLLTIRFPEGRFSWPSQICLFYNGFEAFLARTFFWPFDVDSLKKASPFHDICKYI